MNSASSVIFLDFHSKNKINCTCGNFQCFSDFCKRNLDKIRVIAEFKLAIICRNNWSFSFNGGPIFLELKLQYVMEVFLPHQVFQENVCKREWLTLEGHRKMRNTYRLLTSKWSLGCLESKVL